jgi:hypothetical protein
MIHTITFASCPDKANLVHPYGNKALPAGYPQTFNPWSEMQELMAKTHDTIIWIVTSDQLPSFMGKTREYGLQKYFVVDHRDLKVRQGERSPSFKVRRTATTRIVCGV